MRNAKRKKSRGFGSVYKRGSLYWIKYYVNGSPRRESSRSSDKTEAVELLKQRLGETATGTYVGVPSSRIRLEDLFQAVLDDYILKDKRDIYHVRFRIRTHLKPEIGHIRAAEFGTDDVKRYIRTRQKEDAANATINRELAIIRRAFSLGARMHPPKVATIPPIEKLPEDNTRQGFIEQEQYEILRDALKRARLPFIIAYHLGNRKGEILRLEWPMVNLGTLEITLPGRLAKNKKSRILPIYGELEQALRDARATTPKECRWVCNENGKRVVSFRGEWESVTAAVGMKGLLFHDLRRSAVRNMIRAGISEVVAMAISGHKTRSVFDRYNIVSGEDLRNAGKLLVQAQNARKTGTAAGK